MRIFDLATENCPRIKLGGKRRVGEWREIESRLTIQIGSQMKENVKKIKEKKESKTIEKRVEIRHNFPFVLTAIERV